MKTEFRESFARDLKALRGNAALLRQIRSALERVESAVVISDIHQCRKLQADGEYYRLRVGDYRIGIALNGETAILVRCLHRKEIYRYFP